MKGSASGGFTIVESMIVLGITGVLFISLAAMVSGQQSKARFKEAMTDIVTQIQSQVNEVATGHYPSPGTFTCLAGVDSGGRSPIYSGVFTEQGANTGCTFLGRAMMLAIPGTDPQQYKIHTIVGLRTTATGGEPATLAQAGARPMAPGTTHSLSWPTTLSTTKVMRHGLEVVYMRSLNGNGTGVPEDIAGIAIVASPNQQVTIDPNGSAESGTVIPSIIPISRGASATPGLPERNGVERLTSELGLATSTASALDGPVEICLRSGTTRQTGLITIGRNNSTTSIEFTIHNNQNCA